MNSAAKKILKAISFQEVHVEMNRHLADLKRLDPMKIFYKKMDQKIYNGAYEVPVRLFFPDEASLEKEGKGSPVLLFLHGGGWVTEHVDNYERVCARLSLETGYVVVAVEYRLAPEYRFPMGLLDCCAVADALFEGKLVPQVGAEDVTLVGDSAGGNLAAAMSLRFRDEGRPMPRRQILIYPAVYNDYSENSPFPSVRENGEGYLLTAGKLRDYLDLYAGGPEDRENPYFAPFLAKDLSGQPDTLILTAELDPLRDEGEAYGKRLWEAGNKVAVHRIEDALHGYFALGIRNAWVKESMEHINRFLRGDGDATV